MMFDKLITMLTDHSAINTTNVTLLQQENHYVELIIKLIKW